MVADLGTAEAVEEVTEIDTEERGGGGAGGKGYHPTLPSTKRYGGISASKRDVKKM